MQLIVHLISSSGASLCHRAESAAINVDLLGNIDDHRNSKVFTTAYVIEYVLFPSNYKTGKTVMVVAPATDSPGSCKVWALVHVGCNELRAAGLIMRSRYIHNNTQ